MATDPSDPSSASHHSKYRLRVTAGPSYSSSTHQVVPVNAPESLTFDTPHITICLAVRLKRFTGFPSSSPQTSNYFDHPLHKGDQYSISFSFIPKQDIPGPDLVFGNDFDRPIRDRLPPGFNQAFNWVKWWIDPGLEGDVYSDKPYLYGPALSSWNQLRVGENIANGDEEVAWKMPNADSFHEVVVEEGADGDGEEVRRKAKVPSDAAGRKRFFLTKANLEAFTFEKGRCYQSDFGNGYLDFNEFSLKLPGFTLNVIKYVDSKTHELRYTLKNFKTGEVYCVVLFTLLFGDELKEMEKREGGDNVGGATKGDKTDTTNAEEYGTEPQPSEDDVD